MNSLNPLADLDELVILCRDDKARLYIVEAVACYRSGAYRSAIVAAWIAVCYDIIDKLRELALSGDRAADQQVQKIERARSSTDLTQALKFERGILTLAKDQFDLISPLEYVDLSRLQEDRNRCAHPSLVSQDEAFNPSGELARLHIRSAVLHLLQHQPVQGKFALDRLLRDVNSDYFPDSTDKAVQALSSGPLKRPRDSLVRNFVIVLLKGVLDPKCGRRVSFRYGATLCAVKEMHRQIFDITIKEQFPSLIRELPDDLLDRGTWLLTELDDYWHILPDDVQLRLEAYVGNLPTEHFDVVTFIQNYAPLRSPAERRMHRASRQNIKEVPFSRLPPVLADRCIELYLRSDSVAQANDWSSEIIWRAREFTCEQQHKILSGVSCNDQLRNSHSLTAVINKLRQTHKLSPDEFESTLETNGLQEFMLNSGEPASDATDTG